MLILRENFLTNGFTVDKQIERQNLLLQTTVRLRKYMMRNSLVNSQSRNLKPKRGLSLSLQKKRNKATNQNDENMTFTQTKNKIKQIQDHSHTPIQKNKIKFVQGYKTNQTNTKFLKQSIFKDVSQDVKLGGSKKLFNNTILKPIRNNQFQGRISNRTESKLMYGDSLTVGLQFKALRQQKFVNLSENIKYFQSITSQQQNMFSSKELNQQIYNTIEPSESITQKQFIPISNLSSTLYLQTKDYRTLQVQFQANKKQGKGITSKTIQKIKNIQAGIDELLSKTKQTRAIFEGSSTIQVK